MNWAKRAVGVFLHYYPIKGKSFYRFLPLFFVAGASIEWFMINVPAAGAGETFYDVWRRNQSERRYQQRLQAEAAKTELSEQYQEE